MGLEYIGGIMRASRCYYAAVLVMATNGGSGRGAEWRGVIRIKWASFFFFLATFLPFLFFLPVGEVREFRCRWARLGLA